MNEGIPFRLSDGYDFLLRSQELRELADLLDVAPGGAAGSPSAFSAGQRALAYASIKPDHRPFEWPEVEETELLWAIERTMQEGREVSPGLRTLRALLANMADHEE